MKSTLRLRRHKLGLETGGTHVVGLRIDINKIDVSAAVKATVRAGHKGVGTCPEKIAFSKADAETGDMKR